MKSIRNSVQIIGNVGNAPEIREFKGGRVSARFSVATHDDYKTAEGEKIRNTYWHQVVAWGGMADYVARHVTKGRTIALEGKLSSRVFEDQHGKKHQITEIVAVNVLLTGQRKTALPEVEPPAPKTALVSGKKSATKKEDLPF